MSERFDNFTEVSQVTPTNDGKFTCDVPDGWQQGRGAFGGYGVGIAIRALQALESERPLRALTAELPGPLVPGLADIRTQTLRRGKGMTSLEALVTQNKECKVRLTGLFGVPRAEDLGWDPEPPKMQSIDEVKAIPEGMLPPRFARHFEYRVTGPLPFGSGKEPVTEGWIRPRVQLESWGPAEVAALADAYWPSFFSTLSDFRPMATVTFALTLTEVAQHLDPSEALYYRARSVAASAGYVVELRELWTPRGELVALNPQTFLVIK